MASFNGIIASADFTGGSKTIATGDNVPAKLFLHPICSVNVTAVSGTFGAEVWGYVGNARFALGGVTNISATGNYIIGLTQTSHITDSIPRPAYVAFEGVSFAAARAVGVSATVGILGEY